MRAWMMCPKCGEGVLVGQLHTLEECRLVCPRAKEIEYRNIDFVCSELVYLACDKCGWELDVTGMTHEDTLEVLRRIAASFARQRLAEHVKEV